LYRGCGRFRTLLGFSFIETDHVSPSMDKALSGVAAVTNLRMVFGRPTGR